MASKRPSLSAHRMSEALGVHRSSSFSVLDIQAPVGQRVEGDDIMAEIGAAARKRAARELAALAAYRRFNELTIAQSPKSCEAILEVVTENLDVPNVTLLALRDTKGALLWQPGSPGFDFDADDLHVIAQDPTLLRRVPEDVQFGSHSMPLARVCGIEGCDVRMSARHSSPPHRASKKCSLEGAAHCSCEVCFPG